MRYKKTCGIISCFLALVLFMFLVPAPAMADVSEGVIDIQDVGLPTYGESSEGAEGDFLDDSSDLDESTAEDCGTGDDVMPLSYSGTAADIVSVALGEPDGTPSGGDYNKYNNYSGQAWCAYFVVWCARQAGVGDGVIPSIYGCANLVSWYRNKGLWHDYSYTPQAGDLIFYSSSNGGSAAHVGLVTGVSGGYVHTKEGNTNNGKVGSFSNRKVGSNGFPSYGWYIIGYASPQYATAQKSDTRNGEVTTIPDGDYEILCYSSRNYGVNVKDASTWNGTNVQLYNNDGTDSMKWHFSRNSDGTYTITSLLYGHGRVLDVANGGTENGTNVQIYVPNGTAAQKWYVERCSNGSYSLRAAVNNLYLDVNGGVFANYTNMQVYVGNWTVAQQFALVRLVKMYRLYNPYTGEHLYTSSTDERDSLASKGWRREGVGWTAPAESATPVYRLYNPYVQGGDHHYTTSKAEYDALAKRGWRKEGIAWYSDDQKGVPLYRQYNPYARTGTHNYTADKGENDALVRLGWRAEGVGWYGVK